MIDAYPANTVNIDEAPDDAVRDDVVFGDIDLIKEGSAMIYPCVSDALAVLPRSRGLLFERRKIDRLACGGGNEHGFKISADGFVEVFDKSGLAFNFKGDIWEAEFESCHGRLIPSLR